MVRLWVGGDKSSVIRLWGDKVEGESFARGDCNWGGCVGRWCGNLGQWKLSRICRVSDSSEDS